MDKAILSKVDSKTVSFVFLSAFFAALAGLALLLFMPAIAELLGMEEIVPLINMANWIASIILFTAAVFALNNFYLSKNSGIWILAAAGCLLWSADAGTGLSDVFQLWMTEKSGTGILKSGYGWSIALYSLILTMLGTRLLVKIRRDLAACNALLVAGLFGILAFTVSFGWLSTESLNIPSESNLAEILQKADFSDHFLETGFALFGKIFLLLSFSLHSKQL